MLIRKLGQSDIEISALGLGCWAIGGPMAFDGVQAGWGQVDDAESIRAIHRGLDLGITFFDTADVYGCGHSERVVIATKGWRALRLVEEHAGALQFGPLSPDQMVQIEYLLGRAAPSRRLANHRRMF